MTVILYGASISAPLLPSRRVRNAEEAVEEWARLEKSSRHATISEVEQLTRRIEALERKLSRVKSKKKIRRRK